MPGKSKSYSNTLESVPQDGTATVPQYGTPEPSKHFARTPKEVLFDKRLNCYDKTVYDALSWQCWQGKTASIGSRTIAKKLCISHSRAQQSLLNLETCGHIKKSATRIRFRNVYELTSPVFAQKQGRDTVIRSSPRGKRMVSVAVEDVA